MVELKQLVSMRPRRSRRRRRRLKRRLAADSRNSSKPPSSDELAKKAAPQPLCRASGRKPGRAKDDPGGRLE
ncbi:hypothetical protein J2Z30_005970 [Streptomyces iranensis]|uniref:DUF6444 domain-containing protein n=1 Tax=Streptomyces iranensis TaxID=576784 RepID=A0ABS4MYV9_9ACTN|nr:hypothetical protein [Streptomyces iranensis]